jgi:hypothetical protein
MAGHLAVSGHAVADQDLGALEAVSRRWAWDGDILPELTLLGCRVVPVTCLHEDMHRDRVLSLTGILVRARCWRRGLTVARTWRGFGAAAVLTGPIALDGVPPGVPAPGRGSGQAASLRA